MNLLDIQEAVRAALGSPAPVPEGEYFRLPLRGALLLRRRLSVAVGADTSLSTNGRVVGQLIISISTGILDLYLGNMSGTDMGFGDLRYTPAPGYPILTPMPEGMGVSEFTLRNSHPTEVLTGMIILTD
jgi:hypothetical protein